MCRPGHLCSTTIFNLKWYFHTYSALLRFKNCSMPYWHFNIQLYSRFPAEFFDVCVFMVMKEHVAQCNSMTHRCVFNHFWTTMELCGTEEEDSSGLIHSQYLLVGSSGPREGYVDSLGTLWDNTFSSQLITYCCFVMPIASNPPLMCLFAL